MPLIVHVFAGDGLAVVVGASFRERFIASNDHAPPPVL